MNKQILVDGVLFSVSLISQQGNRLVSCPDHRSKVSRLNLFKLSAVSGRTHSLGSYL